MTTATAPVGELEEPTIRVFGGIGVFDAGEPSSIGGPRQQKLLALLAIRAGAVVDIDWLAEHLWTDDDRPAAPAPALRTYVSRLRSSFPEAAQSWIETVPSGYRLAAPERAVEHLRVEALRASAKEARDREDPLAAQELLNEALGLWRGAPFRELEDDEWARARIEHLEQDRLEMLEERWETALVLGRHTQITGELASFTSEHGLRDRAARQFAMALHRSGRTPEALRVLTNHRQTVADETGLDPSPAVIELEQALIDGDASLDAESAGRPLRGYRLIEEAGVGAFAIVWRGIQPSVNREVAIKQIRSELASEPEFIRRFEAEAHLVARIEHPHIVPLIDFWRDPDSAYLVMRWLPGGTLEQRLDDGPLPISETLVLARQIGGALAAAHSHGIIHRDVKTGNILFDEAGHGFLGDFGIALEATKSAGPEAALSPGSPAYSAPEQIRRQPLGPEADVFSLGVVVFECLTGALPFAEMSAQDLVERQLTEPFPPLTELRSDVPSSVSDAVAKATAKEAADRFPSVAAFLDALEPAAAAAHVEDTPFNGDVANPYNGLQAFDDGDTDRFFGRERLVSELIGRLAGDTISSRCAIVVGPSGSGKSSVVRAGLVPAIRAGRVAGSDQWFTTTMVPGTDPFESLAAALLRIAVDPPAMLLDQLRDGNRGILRGVGRCLDSDTGRILLVIDQFEEVFAGSSADDAAQFLHALAAAVSEPRSSLRLVATLRADFYDRPLAHQTFATVLKQTSVDVTPLAPDELERAIVEPARRQGVAFESGLVARIAAEAAGQPSPLPLLQYALGELFDRRNGNVLTTDAYDAIGGLSGALATRAEAIYAAANSGPRVVLRRLFGRMVDPRAGSVDLRRRTSVPDLGSGDDVTWVLNELGRARLVTFDRDVATREPTVEVAHEALLREWPRLVDWLQEDAALLRSLDELNRASDTWHGGGREVSDLYRGGRLESAAGLSSTAAERLRPVDVDFVESSQAAADKERSVEDGRVKRLRRLVAVVVVALVMALIAGGLAVVAQRDANDQSLAAIAAATEAENQTRLAEGEAEAALAANEQSELATLVSRSAALRGEDADVSVLLALEAHRRSPSPESEQAVLNALGSSDLPNRLSNNDSSLFAPGVACGRKGVTNGFEVVASPDGMSEFEVSALGVMASRDPLTGVVTEYGTSPAPCGAWMADFEQGFAVAQDGQRTRMWIGPIGGSSEIETQFDERTILMAGSFGLDGRIPIATLGALGGTESVGLLDSATGDPVGTPIGGGDHWVSDVASDDGSLWAVSFGTQNPTGFD
ncbi:MAG: serine/threonine protein kinase/DNA-binding SARP family transcriptional activator [Acidimicrobiales bacterium]|jgi:serine/threonine protein kinase/DNA-binding SARP family transcriptional activator